MVEKTSATTKYADGQPYVKGEAELTQIHKVNDVPSDMIKGAKKAQLMSDLKNVNHKMAYETTKGKKADNEHVIQ